jgi:hypothetical protein
VCHDHRVPHRPDKDKAIIRINFSAFQTPLELPKAHQPLPCSREVIWWLCHTGHEILQKTLWPLQHFFAKS